MFKNPKNLRDFARCFVFCAGLHPIAAIRIIPRMSVVYRLFPLLAAMLFCAFTAQAAERVTVFAAASLRNALDEISALYEGEAVLSYGGSGQIARQVSQGAPADIVILANLAWMDWLAERDLLASESQTDLLGNTLVLIAPSDATDLTDVTATSLLGRLEGGRLAIAHTQGVPAGIYGRQWLEALEMWQALRPHLAETENVRAALALVAREEVRLGLVYASDAFAEPRVRVLHRADPALHDPIVYPLALIKGRESTGAKAFFELLLSPQSAEIFRQHGFAVIGG